MAPNAPSIGRTIRSATGLASTCSRWSGTETSPTCACSSSVVWRRTRRDDSSDSAATRTAPNVASSATGSSTLDIDVHDLSHPEDPHAEERDGGDHHAQADPRGEQQVQVAGV